MTKGLIIFIGECFRTGGHGSRTRDTPESILSQQSASLTHVKLINIIKEKHNMEIDIAINSYKTNNQDLLLTWYSSENIIFSNFIEIMIGQEALINTALHNEKLANISCYEFIFICRIDLFLKDLMFELFDPYSQKLTFPSVCWIKDSVCNGMPRVNDTMLFIPKQMLNSNFIVNKKVSFRHESWFTYVHDYKLNFYDLTVYLDTYHDSDSAKDFNPLYYMIGRQESSIWHSIAYILNRNTMQPKLDLVTHVDYMKGKKNMALLLVGLHYKESYTSPCVENSTGTIDFRLCVKNIKTKLIGYFNKFYDIDIYINTNDSPHLDDLIKIYDPIMFLTDNNFKRAYKMFKLIESLMLDIKNGKKCDIVLITRLDIYFMMNFLNVDFNKFNMVSILENNDVCDDNFHLFPVKYLSTFYSILNKIIENKKHMENTILHGLIYDFHKHFDVHYIHNQHAFVGDLSFYKIRYFADINLILNKNDFSDDVWYNSCNKTSCILLQNKKINFIKKKEEPSPFSWIAYTIQEPGLYELSFDIFTNKNINFDFIKLHKPAVFYKTENIPANKWININLIIKTTQCEDLLCFIFDDFKSSINIIYDNIQITKKKDPVAFSKKIHIWQHNWNSMHDLVFMYDPIIKSLKYLLKEKYPDVEIEHRVNCYEWDTINPHDTLIWVGPLMVPGFNVLKNKNIYTVYYNTEPNLDNFNSHEIWTYSKHNFNNYINANSNQIIRFFPISCDENVPLIPYSIKNNNNLGLIFFGNWAYRPEKKEIILSYPLLNEKIIEIYTAWSDATFNNIIESGPNIFLNLTKTDHPSLPSVRINKLLSHKCIIISEHTNPIDEELYDGLVYFCKIEEIEAVYKNLLEKSAEELEEESNTIYAKFCSKFNYKSAVNLILDNIN